MNCWHCERPANGTCNFCGRGLCKSHASTSPTIVSIYKGKDEVQKAIVVADTLFCGICKPNEEPVPLEDLK